MEDERLGRKAEIMSRRPLTKAETVRDTEDREDALHILEVAQSLNDGYD